MIPSDLEPGLVSGATAASGTVNRNAPCPCGSRRRYKACCGADALAATRPAIASLDALMQHALALHRKSRLVEAAMLYREALAQVPDLPDAVHMLGVTHLQAGDHMEALDHLRRAGELFGWRVPAVRHNFGLALAKVIAHRDRPAVARLWESYDRWRDSLRPLPGAARERVSVVVPSFNHARYVEAALESVYSQTYRNIEIIIVDDGSTDGSPDRIRAVLRNSPFPFQFRARANRGAAATINEAVDLGSGDFVNVLNSDDLFAPTRVATMVDAIRRSGASWGFSRAELVDETGAAVPADASPRAAELHYLSDDIAACDTVGMSFLFGNPALSTGALFIARRLFDRLDGFDDLRYNHDWDFCLRASLVAEPVFVASPEYVYRLHACNTILESAPEARREANAMFRRFYRNAVTARDADNPFAPVPAVWGARFFERALASGHGALLPDGELLRLADRVVTECSSDITA